MVNTLSAFAIFSAGLAAFASAADYTVADTSVDPSGNPIYTPETDGTVTAGKAFEVTWNATSPGTVTIYLCIGPEINCVNEPVPFANKIANKGSFTWQVPTTLAPSEKEGTGYGIQLVSDQNPKIYQWSGQFGIANPSYSGSASKSASKGSPTPYPTATGGGNSTYIQPTKSMTVPSSLKPTTEATSSAGKPSSSTPTSQPTGAAGTVQLGMGALVGGVLAALAL